MSCCVVGCNNKCKYKSPGIKFYSFPKVYYKQEKRKLWIRAVRRVNADGSPWEPTVSSVICSQHFIGGEKSEHPHSPAYLPTIFPEEYYGKQKKTETAQLKAQNRFVRALQRSLNSKVVEKKDTKLTTNSNEVNNAQNNSIVDVIIKEENIDISEPTFCEASTQIDFYDAEVYIDTQINMFSVSVKNGDTCEAGTQSNIVFPKPKRRIIIPQLSTAEIGCGPTVEYVDKGVGPMDEEESLLQYQRGFQGFSSIKNEQDLIDLAGVNFSRFQSLLQELGNLKSKSLMSKENMLLLFLMKSKLGLHFSSVAVLFGLHRTTASRIFNKFSKYFSNRCDNNLMPLDSVFVNDESMVVDCVKEENNFDYTEVKIKEPSEVS